VHKAHRNGNNAVVAAASERHQSRLSATLREGERVTPLELFFDLVFVLAITQCTALMSHETSWSGLAQGLLVLGMLWWAWVGYAWLTSVLDPEEGAVRLVMFGAMAALLIVSLCVPEAFGHLALVFALTYGAVRVAHIGLFMLASPDDDDLRHSVLGLAASTAIAVLLLAIASLFDGVAQGALWALALFLDMGGPYFFGSEGWKLVPGHFAERHGLIVIIALGESIVAIGVGASGALTLGIGAAAVLGVAVAAAMWWIYFDIVAIVSGRRLAEADVGRVQNEMARDSYSYLHLPMVAGIVLVALGMKKTIGHFDDHLHTVEAFALLGGVALYLLGLAAFRYRHVHTINRQRLGLAIVLLILVPVATAAPALIALAVVNVALWTMIAYETRLYGENRHAVRRPQTAET
jgi:low temperature requirement protein LtrA